MQPKKFEYRKWLKTDQYRKVFRFFDKKVIILMIIGMTAGFALSAVEAAFAYSLQAFLLNIGIMDKTAVSLPNWLPITNLNMALSFILGVGVLRGTLQWLLLYTQGRTTEEMNFTQRKRLLKWTFHSRSINSSEILSLFGDIVNRTSTASSAIQTSITHVTTALFFALYLFWIMPWLTTATFGVLVVFLYMMRWTDRKFVASGAKAAAEYKNIIDQIIISVRNLLLMRIYNTQHMEEHTAQESLKSCSQQAFILYYFSALKFSITQILGVTLACIVVVIAKKQGLLATGLLVSYFYVLMRMLQTISSLSLSIASFLQNYPSMHILAKWWHNKSFDRMERDNIIEAQKTSEMLPEGPIGWELKNVSFHYPSNQQPIIDHLTFSIKPADILVITGPSGAGKSTLLNIILGELKPNTGKITLISQNKHYTFELFREQLLKSTGYVGADSYIVAGTIYKNLVYGLERTPDPNEILEALKQAECDFVFNMPKGLEHEITDQGEGLSAGQKQRLSLARALLRKPRVLILDEATANLDSETENKLLKTLEQLRGKTTIVAVTHRDSVLKISDNRLTLSENLSQSAPSLNSVATDSSTHRLT